MSCKRMWWEVVWSGMNDMVIKFYCCRTVPLMWPVINVWQVTCVTPQHVAVVEGRGWGVKMCKTLV